MNNKAIGLICLLALFLMGADAGDQIRDEYQVPREQRDALRQRIETLREEQEYLLFQKEMYAADSKYLVLNMAAKTGRLMYRNRVLKDFRFRSANKYPSTMLGRGRLVLTKKTDMKKERHALIFGNALVIQWKRTKVPPQEVDIPVISVTKKEMRSLYYAVEPGALAYVVR
jgi:hypothetical protein